MQQAQLWEAPGQPRPRGLGRGSPGPSAPTQDQTSAAWSSQTGWTARAPGPRPFLPWLKSGSGVTRDGVRCLLLTSSVSGVLCVGPGPAPADFREPGAKEKVSGGRCELEDGFGLGRSGACVERLGARRPILPGPRVSLERPCSGHRLGVEREASKGTPAGSFIHCTPFVIFLQEENYLRSSSLLTPAPWPRVFTAWRFWPIPGERWVSSEGPASFSMQKKVSSDHLSLSWQVFYFWWYCIQVEKQYFSWMSEGIFLYRNTSLCNRQVFPLKRNRNAHLFLCTSKPVHPHNS